MATNDQLSRVQSKIHLGEKFSDEEKLYRYKGILYPTIMCPEDHLKALVNLEAREDDLMLVVYPKCGFNWVMGVVRKIIAESTGVKTESKGPPLIEFLGPDAIKLMEQSPSPRLLGTHMHPDNIPPTFYTKKTKMLVVFRNPKDTLVSFYHFCNNNPVLPSVKSWESFYSQFMSGEVTWGSYFDHALAWDKRMNDPNVMVVTYEGLKQDLSEGIRQISSFYGYPLTEAQVQQVTDNSSFKAMKDSAANSHGTMGSVIFRKGEVGDWKNHFTPEQSREMDEAFNKHLAGTKLGEKLDYQRYCQ